MYVSIVCVHIVGQGLFVQFKSDAGSRVCAMQWGTEKKGLINIESEWPEKGRTRMTALPVGDDQS